MLNEHTTQDSSSGDATRSDMDNQRHPRPAKTAKAPKVNNPFEKGSLSYHSLLLSLWFYGWWFLWPLLSLIGPSDSALASLAKLDILAKLGYLLQQLWLGLPLWFWLSSIVSWLLLLALCLIHLPKDIGDTGQAKDDKSIQPSSTAG